MPELTQIEDTEDLVSHNRRLLESIVKQNEMIVKSICAPKMFATLGVSPGDWLKDVPNLTGKGDAKED